MPLPTDLRSLLADAKFFARSDRDLFFAINMEARYEMHGPRMKLSRSELRKLLQVACRT